MDSELRIRTALVRIGASDVLSWARENCTKSLVQLNRELAAGVAPIDLERLMRKVASQSHRYDEFVKAEAVRRLNEHFPSGLGGANEAETHGFAAGWAMWASLFGPSARRRAHAVWNSLAARMRDNPHWCPKSPDDPALVSAFGSMSFEPTEEERRFEGVVARMERVTRRGNRPWSELKAVENLASVKPGYGLLYGLYSVDGQVCNGGFTQFYENTGGVAACFAIKAFRAIGHNELADVVEESIRYASVNCPQSLVPSVQACVSTPHEPARPFDILDSEYFSVSGCQEIGWLDSAMIQLVSARPELFD